MDQWQLCKPTGERQAAPKNTSTWEKMKRSAVRSSLFPLALYLDVFNLSLSYSIQTSVSGAALLHRRGGQQRAS